MPVKEQRHFILQQIIEYANNDGANVSELVGDEKLEGLGIDSYAIIAILASIELDLIALYPKENEFGIEIHRMEKGTVNSFVEEIMELLQKDA